MYTPLSRQHLFINNIAEETARPEVKSSLSGSSHIAVTIIRNLVLMANYSISANVFCLFAMSSQGKTQREEKRKKKLLPASEHTSSL